MSGLLWIKEKNKKKISCAQKTLNTITSYKKKMLPEPQMTVTCSTCILNFMTHVCIYRIHMYDLLFFPLVSLDFFKL